MRKYLDINLTEIAYDEIKKIITEGKIPPGEKIKKRIIAETIGISNTPVTEALKKLVGENFIEYRNRFGYFTKKYTNNELAEFFELRAALESVAIRIIIVNNYNIDKIVTFWDSYKHTTLEKYTQKDNDFHKLIVSLCKNQILIDTWFKSGYDIKSNQRGLQNSIEESQKDHNQIIAALKKKDADKAQLLMSEHFLRAAQHVREQ